MKCLNKTRTSVLLSAEQVDDVCLATVISYDEKRFFSELDKSLFNTDYSD